MVISLSRQSDVVGPGGLRQERKNLLALELGERQECAVGYGR
jgi:hypothetical protein